MPLFEGGFHFYSQLFLSFFSHKNCQHCLTLPGKESIKNPSCDENLVEGGGGEEAGQVRTEVWYVVSGVVEVRE